MKIIEGMKEIKRLNTKISDLQGKIGLYCADYEHEAPTYPDQKGQVQEWLQSIEDTLKRILELKVAIQRTNLTTQVTIELGGKQVTKSIAEWVHRRRDLAKVAQAAYQQLSNRGLRDGQVKMSSGEMRDVKVRLYFDPREKDAKVAAYRDEPSIVDGTLEVVNAVTDLMGV